MMKNFRLPETKEYYWVFSNDYMLMCGYTTNPYLMSMFIKQREQMGVRPNEYIVGVVSKESEKEFIDWYNHYTSIKFDSGYGITEMSELQACETNDKEIVVYTDEEYSATCDYPSDSYYYTALPHIMNNIISLYIALKLVFDVDQIDEYRKFMSVVAMHVNLITEFEDDDNFVEALQSVSPSIVSEYCKYMGSSLIDDIKSGNFVIYDESDMIDIAKVIYERIECLYL